MADLSLQDAALLTCSTLIEALIRERQRNAMLEEEISRLVSQSSGSEMEVGKSLKDLMVELSCEDEQNIFVVRRINKLRSDAGQVIRDYFSQMGAVVKVLLLPWRRPRDSGRPRPSSLGFVLMSDSAETAMILSKVEHIIAGFTIPVEPYHREQCLSAHYNS